MCYSYSISSIMLFSSRTSLTPCSPPLSDGRGPGSPDDDADLHAAGPPGRRELVRLLWAPAGHVFRRQNPAHIQHTGLLRAAFLSPVGPWLWRPLLLFLGLRSVPGLLLHRRHHAGLVHGDGRDRGRPGAPRPQPREDLRALARLSPPGVWSVRWHAGPVGFPLQKAVQVKMMSHFSIRTR